MNFTYLDHHEMKENVDINLQHLNKSIKGTTEVGQKLVKRQLFREIDVENVANKIKKTAYIVDSEEEESPFKSQIINNGSPQSIDEVSQIIESVSREVSTPTSPSAFPLVPISACEQHGEQIYSYNYCIQCSIYLLCPVCIKNEHSRHMILTFSSESETKCLTKQFLIQKIEQTLQRLKSKENDMKNKSAEVELIGVNVKKMEEEVMDHLERTFRQIGDMIRSVYERQQGKYEQRIQEFYRGYNAVGDELRQHLLSIIDQSFDLKQFKPSMIVRQPPPVPDEQINKFKSTLEKTKTFYKSITESLNQLSLKIEQSSKFTSKTNKHSIIPNKKASINKYEKFLSDNCFEDNKKETKGSLIRILDTLSR